MVCTRRLQRRSAVTSWAKVLNAEYSQAEGRHELLNGDSPVSQRAELSSSSSSRWRQEVTTNLRQFGRAGVRLGVGRLVPASDCP